MEASAAFALECKKAGWKLSPERIRECVACGHAADVMFKSKETEDRPILHQLVEKRALEQVRACLDTPHPINFTATDYRGRTLLHRIVLTALSSDVSALLAMVLSRLERGHPGDRVDWEQRDQQGHTCLSLCAGWGHLHLWWPLLLQHSSYFAPHNQCEAGGCSCVIPLTEPVMRSDWNKLGPEDRRHFVLLRGYK